MNEELGKRIIKSLKEKPEDWEVRKRVLRHSSYFFIITEIKGTAYAYDGAVRPVELSEQDAATIAELVIPRLHEKIADYSAEQLAAFPEP
jgi:hypothetical protein